MRPVAFSPSDVGSSTRGVHLLVSQRNEACVPVSSLWRKPCFLWRRRTLGWYVLLRKEKGLKPIGENARKREGTLDRSRAIPECEQTQGRTAESERSRLKQRQS